MCITKKELEQKIEELRKYKAMAEEISQIQKSLEQEVITYMNENDLTEEFTDSAKITYKEQARKSLDKDKLKETEIIIIVMRCNQKLIDRVYSNIGTAF